MTYLGKIIKLFRKNLYLKQVELAERCGITPEYLSKIENGAKIPSMELLKDISKVIDLPVPLILLLSIDEKELSQENNAQAKKLKPITETILSKLFSEDQFSIDLLDKSIQQLKSTSKEMNKPSYS